MKDTLKLTPKISAAFKRALEVRQNAHVPYSKFKVGAALMSRDGELITGCNVENASYGGTVCAERIAIFKAVSEGRTSFSDIVVVTDAAEPAFPCAFCLQVMAEFFDPETKIYLGDTERVRSVFSFKELLPHPFGPVELKTARATAKETDAEGAKRGSGESRSGASSKARSGKASKAQSGQKR
jgi:cytidine deaminase